MLDGFLPHPLRLILKLICEFGMNYLDSEALWTNQFLHGRWSRYVIFIWRHDGG